MPRTPKNPRTNGDEDAKLPSPTDQIEAQEPTLQEAVPEEKDFSRKIAAEIVNKILLHLLMSTSDHPELKIDECWGAEDTRSSSRSPTSITYGERRSPQPLNTTYPTSCLKCLPMDPKHLPRRTRTIPSPKGDPGARGHSHHDDAFRYLRPVRTLGHRIRVELRSQRQT